MCNHESCAGYYFRKFVLPSEPQDGQIMMNDSACAEWYFRDYFATFPRIHVCFPAEDLGPAADLVPWASGSVKIVGTNADGHDT
jgi:hypothetical protein